MAKKVKQLDNTKLEDLFHRHDYNKSGTIDYKEIKPMLKELGYSEAAIEECSLDMVQFTVIFVGSKFIISEHEGLFSIQPTLIVTSLFLIFFRTF